VEEFNVEIADYNARLRDEQSRRVSRMLFRCLFAVVLKLK
jgi:hypothetical protein